MQYNADELVNPEWMDTLYFEKVLREHEDDKSIVVSSVDIKPATKLGEHFASIMYRVRVEYSTTTSSSNSRSMIVKTRPYLEGLKKDMVDGNPLFEIEMRIYTKMIPAMHRLLKSIGDSTVFGPKVIYCSNHPSDTLIFEDLNELDYTVPEQLFELDDMKNIVETMGKWHACSFYLNADPKFDEDFSFYKECQFGDFVTAMYKSNFTALKNVLMTWPGYEVYAPNLDRLIENFKPLTEKMYQRTKYFNVLNHADLHLKNLMVQEKDGVIEDFLFLDFQNVTFASPAIDLSYILYAICSSDCREQNREELLNFYHQVFEGTLTKLGFTEKIPSFVDLQGELNQHGFIQVIIAFNFLLFMNTDYENASPEDLFDLVSDKIKREKEAVYSRPDVAEILKKFVKEFVEKGYF